MCETTSGKKMLSHRNSKNKVINSCERLTSFCERRTTPMNRLCHVCKVLLNQLLLVLYYRKNGNSMLPE